MQSPYENYLKVGGDEQPSRSGQKNADRSRPHRPTVVVLGAGFGGLWAARTLAEGPVDIILIDRHNYHTFFPLLYQVGAGELEPEDIAQPVRKILWKHSKVHFCLGEIEN